MAYYKTINLNLLHYSSSFGFWSASGKLLALVYSSGFGLCSVGGKLSVLVEGLCGISIGRVLDKGCL